jgi:hypothetical protein
MVWKSYVDCSDYEVSDAGEVRRVVRVLPRGRRTPYLLCQFAGSSGYLQVSMSIGGVASKVMVHRAVLRTFVGEPPSPRHEGAHLDGDMLRNVLGNLAWATRAENAAHKLEHGTAYVPRALTADQVIEMRRRYRDEDISYKSLGRAFAVSAPTAHGIVTGRYWPHLPGATASKPKGRRTAA